MGSDPEPGFACVVLVEGPQAALRDAALARIRESVLGDATPEFNEDRFDLANPKCSPEQIIAAARTVPLLSRGRLVWVRGTAHRLAARFLEGELLSYLEAPVPSTCLVLEAPKVDKRLKWVKQVKRIGEVVDCNGPKKPAELRDWIGDRIAAEGKRAGPGTAHALLELVGGDIDGLAAEVAKLCLYVGDREQVSADDVSEVTGQLRPRALYELTDAIGHRRVGDSLRILGLLLDQGEAPLRMLGTLANHFRNLLRARECRSLDAREIQRTLGVHPFAAQKLAEQAHSFDSRRLQVCLASIRRTDAALKGAVPLHPRLIIERLVLSVSA